MALFKSKDDSTPESEEPLKSKESEEPMTPKESEESIKPKKPGFFERRKLWKQERKRARQALKDHYKYAPLRTRIWNLYLKKPVTTLAIIGVLAYIFAPAAIELFGDLLGKTFTGLMDSRNEPVDHAKVLEMCPIDEEGAARIAALDPVGENETWTICVYMVGSNLEDYKENDLSDATKMQVDNILAARGESGRKNGAQLLDQYTTELGQSGLDLPAYLYKPVKPEASSKPVTKDVVVADRPGAASSDIAEMTSATWSDNINIVIQTGGATRWSDVRINPNRTQRFLYSKGEFSEIENMPLQPSSVPETLASFLTYCRDNYPADHTMLVLWNHGGGAFGYGNDSIFGDMFQLSDIRAALSSAYEPNLDDPAFDIIGFDACLMSSLEATHALDGFAKYYAVSEETEPMDGWSYDKWLQAMTDDPTMSPARICQAIADSYTDCYMAQNVNIGILMEWDTTFAVLDAAKAHELYDAYVALCREQVKAASQDLSVLADAGRAANNSTHYAGSAGNVYNTIDLGGYVDNTVDSFPEQSSRVKELVGQTVLYHRDYGGTSDSQGISVYFPAKTDTLGGLYYALMYLDRIVESNDIKALYYYKIAGALNNELTTYVGALTGRDPKKLDVAAFKQFAKSEPQVEGTGFALPIDTLLLEMTQDYKLELASYDKDKKTVTSYGSDEYLVLEDDGLVHSDFAGEWICLDGVPLAVDIVSSSASSIEYRSRVDVDGTTKFLEFAYDRDTETFTISGLREVPSSLYDLLTGTNSEENVNYFLDTKYRTDFEMGVTITPIYEVLDVETNAVSQEKAEKGVEVKSGTKVELKGLKNGSYLASAVMYDSRGDEYHAPAMTYTVSSGKVASCALDADLKNLAW